MPVDLDALLKTDAIDVLDGHFVRMLLRLDREMAPAAQLGAALASRAVREGHVCLDLPAVADRSFGADGILRTPQLSVWVSALRASSLVGEPGQFRPLVLDAGNRLYLYRYWHYERRLAEQLTRRAAHVASVDRELLAVQLDRLFPAEGLGGPDWQRVAAAAALLRGLCVVSGGPGTGKTTTVTRLLAMLLEQADNRPLRVALAAPTGKAATRLSEAVRRMKPALEVSAEVRAAIPEGANTLHRLLGFRPDGGGFRYGRENPLPLDVLVVDEVSMIDHVMMARVVEALPQAARLILLGDKDQLASVQAGAVLGDICADWRGFSASFRQELAVVGAADPGDLPVSDGRSVLDDAIVELRVSYRFGGSIGTLASRINSGDVEGTVALLAARSGGLEWFDTGTLAQAQAMLADRISELFGAYLEALHAGAEPEQVFEAFERVRVLCALRTGALGVEGINRLIEEALRRQGQIAVEHTWYAGRPVMITRNDYTMALFNGDVGLALPAADNAGTLQVCFRKPDGGLRRVSIARLPAHETCYALTVHKSQGSEFDTVVTVLPQEDMRVVGRELLYTAITRARQNVLVIGPEAVLAAAVARRTERRSGLRDSLWTDSAGARV